MLPFCVAEMGGESSKVFFQLSEQLVKRPRFGSQHPLACFLCNASSVVDLLLHNGPGLPCDQGVTGFVQYRLEFGANGFNATVAAFSVQAGFLVVDLALLLLAQSGIAQLILVWKHKLTVCLAAEEAVMASCLRVTLAQYLQLQQQVFIFICLTVFVIFGCSLANREKEIVVFASSSNT